MNFGPQTASNYLHFYPPSVNSVFCFIARLRRRRSANETQPKPTTYSQVSAVWKRMSEISGIPPLQIGRGAKPPFSTTSQLNDNFDGLYLRNETWYYIIGQARWKLQEVSYVVSKVRELLSTNGLKLDLHFYSPYVNSALYFSATLRTRRSANITRPNFAKRWTVDRANNLSLKSWDRPSRKNWGQKSVYIWSFFDVFET